MKSDRFLPELWWKSYSFCHVDSLLEHPLCPNSGCQRKRVNSKETKRTDRVFSLDSIQESYATPEEALLTWAKFIRNGDIEGQWRTFSSRAKQEWNNDYNSYLRAYSDFAAKQGERVPISEVEVKDLDGTDERGASRYEIEIVFADPVPPETESMAFSISAVKEDGVWKVDQPRFERF